MTGRENLNMEQCHIRKGDRVITPRGEVGFVEKVSSEGFALGRYAGALSDDSAEFTLDVRLLVRWKPEAPRPKPYRAVKK